MKTLLALVFLASSISAMEPDYLEQLAAGIHLSLLILKDSCASTNEKEKAFQDLQHYNRQSGYRRAKKLLADDPHPEEIAIKEEAPVAPQ